MTPELLKSYAEVMQQYNIRRVSGEQDDEGEDFCIEMDPSAFPASATTPASPLSPEREPTREEIAFASSIPVTEFEWDGKDPT